MLCACARQRARRRHALHVRCWAARKAAALRAQQPHGLSLVRAEPRSPAARCSRHRCTRTPAGARTSPGCVARGGEQRAKLPLCACSTIPGRRPIGDAAQQRAAQKRSRANLSIASRGQLQAVVCAGAESEAGLRHVQAGDSARRSVAALASGAAARRAATRAHPRRDTAVLVCLRIAAQPGRRLAPLPAAHPCEGCTRDDRSAQRRAAHGATRRSSVRTLSQSAHGALRVTVRALRRF